MRLTLHFFLLVIVTLNFTGIAHAAIDDWWDKCKNSQSDCEISTFKEIAPIYRPSKEEDLMVAFVKSIFTRAESEIWNNDSQFTLSEDATHSLLITIPPTGEFEKLSLPPIAIQAHMDMVLAKKGAKPGEDLRPYFKGQLEFEEVQGWFQSKGNDRSIGADNSTGVAIALRYLIDKSRSHPALEIIFTTQEEAGLVGAANFNFPLNATKLISLDNMNSNLVTVGCQGASMDLVSGEMERVEPQISAKFYQITVSDLKGGHSGAMIHLSRANAINIVATVLLKLSVTNPDLMLGEFNSGNTKVLNIIPNAASAVFSTKSAVDVKIVEDLLRKEIANFSEEDPKVFQIKAVEVTMNHTHVVSPSASIHFLNQLLKTPHGVISQDPEFPNKVKTSTNFSAVNFLLGDTQLGSISFGFMGRSFDVKELNLISEQSRDALLDIQPDLKNGSHKNVAKIDPWMASKNSPLLNLALSDPQFKGTFLVPAYVEATVFAKKYPNLDIIGIGPDVADYHTYNERVRIDSLSEISTALARLLKAQ